MIPPGSQAATVQVGMALAGVVATWADDGRSLWAFDAASGLADRLGRGTVARTGVEARRFREVGLLVRESGTLLLPDRLRADDGGPIEAPGVAFELRPLPPDADHAVADAAWAECAAWLGDAFVAAVERDEFVVVERGGWDAPPEPYVLGIRTGAGEDARWRLECAPAPAAPTLWPVSDPGARGASISAPPERDTIHVAGQLAVDAVRRWAATPHELGVTFGRVEG